MQDGAMFCKIWGSNSYIHEDSSLMGHNAVCIGTPDYVEDGGSKLLWTVITYIPI
jgi:hypothetical protein